MLEVMENIKYKKYTHGVKEIGRKALLNNTSIFIKEPLVEGSEKNKKSRRKAELINTEFNFTVILNKIRLNPHEEINKARKELEKIKDKSYKEEIAKDIDFLHKVKDFRLKFIFASIIALKLNIVKWYESKEGNWEKNMINKREISNKVIEIMFRSFEMNYFLKGKAYEFEETKETLKKIIKRSKEFRTIEKLKLIEVINRLSEKGELEVVEEVLRRSSNSKSSETKKEVLKKLAFLAFQGVKIKEVLTYLEKGNNFYDSFLFSLSDHIKSHKELKKYSEDIDELVFEMKEKNRELLIKLLQALTALTYIDCFFPPNKVEVIEGKVMKNTKRIFKAYVLGRKKYEEERYSGMDDSLGEELVKAWKENEEREVEGIKIKFTDDLEELIKIGDVYSLRTCLFYGSDHPYKIGLFGFLLNPWVKLIKVEKDSITLARTKAMLGRQLIKGLGKNWRERIIIVVDNYVGVQEGVPYLKEEIKRIEDKFSEFGVELLDYSSDSYRKAVWNARFYPFNAPLYIDIKINHNLGIAYLE